MSKPKGRRLTGHAARRLAVKRANRRAYGRKCLPVEIEDSRKESRARAQRMGPTAAEWADDRTTDTNTGGTK